MIMTTFVAVWEEDAMHMAEQASRRPGVLYAEVYRDQGRWITIVWRR